MESGQDDLVADLRAQAQQYEHLSKNEDTTKNDTSKQRVDSDGVVYEFDEEKRAWFPKVTPKLYTGE